MSATLRNVTVALFVFGLCVCGGSCESCATTTDSFGTVRLEYTAAITGDDTKPCRIVVYLPKDDTFQDPKPERVVIHDYTGNEVGRILWQCYRSDVSLEHADLLQYDRVTEIEFADLDDDGVDEAIISWDSDSAGSGWIQTLEVLDYDLEREEFRSYKGVSASGPFGGFATDSLHPDGDVERVFAYSFQSDGMDSRIGGGECRWCPHRYRVAAYTITESGLVIDPHWNNGQIAYTQLRFPSGSIWNPTNEYRSLKDCYMRSSLYNALDTGPPFVVLSPQPNQELSMPVQLRVEIPQEMRRLGIRVISNPPDGRSGEEILLEDIIEGWAYEPSTSLKVEDMLYYAAPSWSEGAVVLYDPGAPDDPAGQITIPILFEAVETRIVQIFLPNEQWRSDPFTEELLYPVERTIRSGVSPEREALIQLFRGPTGAERDQGFFSYLEPVCKAQNVYYPQHSCSRKLPRLEINDGVAYVWTYDIDWPDPVPGMGGVHFMSVALDQIRQTLLQFPSISRVVIW